jgi:hypothetical protein
LPSEEPDSDRFKKCFLTHGSSEGLVDLGVWNERQFYVFFQLDAVVNVLVLAQERGGCEVLVTPPHLEGVPIFGRCLQVTSQLQRDVFYTAIHCKKKKNHWQVSVATSTDGTITGEVDRLGDIRPLEVRIDAQLDAGTFAVGVVDHRTDHQPHVGVRVVVVVLVADPLHHAVEGLQVGVPRRVLVLDLDDGVEEVQLGDGDSPVDVVPRGERRRRLGHRLRLDDGRVQRVAHAVGAAPGVDVVRVVVVIDAAADGGAVVDRTFRTDGSQGRAVLAARQDRVELLQDADADAARVVHVGQVDQVLAGGPLREFDGDGRPARRHHERRRR